MAKGQGGRTQVGTELPWQHLCRVYLNVAYLYNTD